MKLTKDLLGCSGGAIIPAIHAAGLPCPDDLLAAAIETGSLSDDDAKAAAERLDAIAAEKARKARKAARENKAHDGAGEQA